MVLYVREVNGGGYVFLGWRCADMRGLDIVLCWLGSICPNRVIL